MANLTTPLQQAREGAIGASYLREKVREEVALLKELSEATVSTAGIMGTGDALVGADAEAKMKDFIARQKLVSDANSFIDNAASVAAAASNLQVAGYESFQPTEAEVKNMPVGILKAFADAGVDLNWTPGIGPAALMDHMRRSTAKGATLPMESISWNSLKVGETAGMLRQKRLMITTPMPIDEVGRPYERMVQALDFVTIMERGGAQVFVQTPPGSGIDNPAGGAAIGADPGEGAATAFTFGGSRLNKQRRAIYTKVSMQDASSHPEIMPDAIELVTIYQRDDIVDQLLNGDNTGTNWRGVEPQIATTNSDPLLANATTLSAPANQQQATLNALEPVRVMEAIMATQYSRGVYPTAIFVHPTDYATIRQAQRAQRYLQTDYEQFPLGEVAGIPLVIVQQLDAGTLMVGDWSPRSVNITVNPGMSVMVFDERYAEEGNLLVRGEVYGNVALKRPFALHKVTGCEHFQVINLG